MSKLLTSMSVGVGLLVLSSFSVSAAVVCNGNVCWHTKEKYEYPPAAQVTIHEDEWSPGPDVVIRDHEGRGYWSGDAWTDF